MAVAGNYVFFDHGGVFEIAFAGEELFEADDCGLDADKKNQSLVTSTSTIFATARTGLKRARMSGW